MTITLSQQPLKPALMANKALQETQFKEKITSLIFCVEFLLKIYDTELAFMDFFLLGITILPHFSLLCLYYYITRSVYLSGLLLAEEK